MSDSSLPRVATGKRPTYLDGGSIDELFRMVLVLAQELSVSRDRTAALEAVLARHAVLPAEAVDAFVPPAAWEAAREADRSAMIARLLRGMSASLSCGCEPPVEK